MKIVFPVIFLLLFSGCKMNDTPLEVDLEKKVILNPEEGNEKDFRFGIATMLTPSQNIYYYAELIEYIGRKLNMPASMIQRSTYSQMNDLIKLGGVDIAFICTGAYIKLKNEIPVRILAVPVVDGKKTYNSLIIVRRDSNINSFEDLKGKSFAFVDSLSLTGKIYPIYRVLKSGYLPEMFFTKTIFSGSHDSSIEMVAQGIVDAAGVDNIIFKYYIKDHPEIVKGVRIIEESPPFGIPPVVMKAGYKKPLYQKVREILINMHTDKEGAKILEKLHFDRFEPPSMLSYKNSEEIFKFVSERGF